MVKWRIHRYWRSKDSEKIGSTEIRSRETECQWVGDDICICSSPEFCCYSSENRTWKAYRILQYALLTWTVILRNGIRNQRLISLFSGSRIALQTIPLKQEQMRRTTTTELTMFLGSTSRESKQSASLLVCILIWDCGDAFKTSFFIFHCFI